jgi:hypothetical protein
MKLLRIDMWYKKDREVEGRRGSLEEGGGRGHSASHLRRFDCSTKWMWKVQISQHACISETIFLEA